MNKLIAAILLACPIIVEAKEYTSFVQQWEGFSSKAYTDSRGNLTIGYGFNLSDSSAQTKLEAHGINYRGLLKGGQITAAQAESLLLQEVAIATATAQEFFPSFDKHPYSVKRILVDLSYNLGPKVENFVKFKAAIERFDYKTASRELVNSKWYSQVGRRSKNHVVSLSITPAPVIAKPYRKK